VPKLTNSFKEHQIPLHRQSCLNPSHLNNRLCWSFTTNPLHPHNLMFLCAPVIPRKTTLHLPLELKTILLLRRRLTVCLPIWYSLLHQTHLRMVLFILNDRVMIHFYDLRKVSLRSRHSILMLGQPRTIALSKIWPKHPQRCLP
jgi:hypothetical protein